MAIYLPPVADAYELYWNGSLIGSFCKMPPHPLWYYRPPPHTFSLGHPGNGVLAIRVWQAPFRSIASGKLGGLTGAPLVGSSETIRLLKGNYDYRQLRSHAFNIAQDYFYGLIGLIGVLAWLRDRRRKLLLWVGIFALGQVLYLLLVLTDISDAVSFLAVQPLISTRTVSLSFLLLFLFGLEDRPRLRRWTWIVASVSMSSAILDGLLTVLFDWSGPHVAAIQIADAAFTVPFMLTQFFPLVLILFALRQRAGLATWLVAATASWAELVNALRNLTLEGERYTHWTLADRLGQPWLTVAGNQFVPSNTGLFLLIVAIVYAVYRYSVDQSERQGALEQEFKSAQEVQRVLIPETLPPLPGYAVTSAYRPAQEVGGDFFQLIAQADGAALLVLGDVSGKGLKAAMTVSLIVGVVRTLAAIYEDPARILASLNERLHGRLQNGFVTCLVVRLEANGRCTMANAGHLAPFLNHEEVSLAGALPLGIIGGAEFEETQVQLEVGDRLTLYTDGLLEARSASGELYGFDRVRELIATQPAAQAASEAAVAFGQDDDITVLTVTRLAVGVESTTSLVAPELVTVG
jgi:hypothetical protein